MTEHVPTYETRPGLLDPERHSWKCSCKAPGGVTVSSREKAEKDFADHVERERAKEDREANPEFLTEAVAVEVTDGDASAGMFAAFFGGGPIRTQFVLNPDGTVTMELESACADVGA